MLDFDPALVERRVHALLDEAEITVAAINGGVAKRVVIAFLRLGRGRGTDGGTLLLDAIATAVIGGTSLFGGRSRIYHAILGALVVGAVANGLQLLGSPSSTEDIATGAILVVAVAIDALSRAGWSYSMTRFPQGFPWGAANAAYQVERAVADHRRSPSIWDVFAHSPRKIGHGDTGDIASDQYHRPDADLDLMAEMGLDI